VNQDGLLQADLGGAEFVRGNREVYPGDLLPAGLFLSLQLAEDFLHLC
jgi:hypothetical protein